MIKGEVVVSSASATSAVEELGGPSRLVAAEEVPAVAVSGSCETEKAAATDEGFLIEIECTFGDSTVVFPFTWRMGSGTVLQALRAACLLALDVPLDDDVNLYDRNGVVLRFEEDTCQRLKGVLQSGRTRVGLVLWTGHPCTTGLPLQCCVTWCLQQVVMVCVVEPENALRDLRQAILEEYDAGSSTAIELHFFLTNNEEAAAETELTESGAYAQLKAASRDGELVNISVVSPNRSPPWRSVGRRLSAAAAAFAEEVLHVLGDRFHSQDVLKIFEECRDKAGPFDNDANDFLTLIAVMLSDPRTMTLESLTSLLVKTALSCGEEGVIDVLGCCAVMAQLRAARRPFEVLKRFFRRLYNSTQIPEGAQGIPLAMVTRQLAQAGLRDAKGLLRRDRTILAELQEKDYTELCLRLYYTDAKVVSRAAVAARMSGISKLRSRRAMTRREQELLQKDYMHEIRHALDGIRSSDVTKFLLTQELHPEPRFHCLLSLVGSLLASHPVQHPSHWLVERFRGKMSDAMDAKIRTFEDSMVTTPLLYRLCWDVLKPELHHLSLLPESQVASALAYWAFFAVQLLCANRCLEFPPVPLVDLQQFSPVGLPISPVVLARNGVVGGVAPAAAAGGGVGAGPAAASPLCPKKPKLKYKYSYLCHDLRRHPGRPRPLK
ncbi:uncharacterized protein Tco025E_01739 [Trypanosoma conorhini]|uniref:Metal-binding domain-containing protein n=1 Tax=Trypanosoma conorhini TaxID=83891 RepID=A0A3R7M3R9_9TRYP|nr:uncharacterized protein Tco025E_01739 [Trypanosoma conorhini]RNF26034.1 hypothetical protein Tco025E_01739 [Trypanosoma conorhini]